MKDEGFEKDRAGSLKGEASPGGVEVRARHDDRHRHRMNRWRLFFEAPDKDFSDTCEYNRPVPKKMDVVRPSACAKDVYLMQNVKPVFNWARAHGESRIVDRILLRLLPEMLKHDRKLTAEMVDGQECIEVPLELYERIKSTAEELVGKTYPGVGG